MANLHDQFLTSVGVGIPVNRQIPDSLRDDCASSFAPSELSMAIVVEDRVADWLDPPGPLMGPNYSKGLPVMVTTSVGNRSMKKTPSGYALAGLTWATLWMQ